MMTDDKRGDIENPNPGPQATTGPSSNASDGASGKNDPNKKRKVVALSAFLLVAVVLAIVLGVTLPSDGSDTSSQNVSADKGAIATTASTKPSVADPIATQPNGETTAGPITNPTTATEETPDDGTTLPTDAPPEGEGEDKGEAPQVYRSQYLKSNGPIVSSVRIINPGVANGYDSCDDLRDDMLNALKHYANTIIVGESRNDWYEKCDPNNSKEPGFGFYGVAVAEESTTAFDGAPSAPSAPLAGASDATVKEDSFETNNQVDGVDEGDIVKSDGNYVYAAYGDLLHVWNATDGTNGMSTTKMPYEENNQTDCSVNYPMPEPIFLEESPPKEVEERKPDSTEGVRRKNSPNRHLSSMWWDPCHQPKPRIVSLLLEGSRLTAIVSEQTYRPYRWNYEENDDEPEPIINDGTKLTIRVYDVSDVPTDGSPLELLGEKEIKGNYDSSRSVGDTGFVITTSHLNTYLFAGDLYRHQPQYCGLNSTEYETLAAETALNNTESFLERMMEEMQLQLDGTCDGIFQVSAMQSGDTDEDKVDGNVLSQFVQVLSFDMSSDFVNKEISTNVAGAFSSGWLYSVYASQDFAATFNVGSSYNKVSGEWDETTFILGFDISGAYPKPIGFAEVGGRPLNQYAADFYDDHLRVVTTESDWSATNGSRTTNKLFVLEVPEAGEGQEMVLVGETGHIGKPNERVFSVRFIGPTAYIVTFERTDPFYIFNLTDPTDPTKLGELEIPGFSSYLHPIEIDGVPLILGIGEHVDERQSRVGVKISLFDISDLTNPTENATFIDEGAYSSAGNDFKAFRYLTQSRKLILPKSKYTRSDEGNFDGFVVYDVSLGAVNSSYEIQHASSYDMYNGCWYNAYMPARSFVFQSKLTTILSHSVKSTDLENGDQLWNVSLDENNKDCSPYFF